MTPVYVRELRTEISASTPAPRVEPDRRDPAALAEETLLRAARAEWLAARVAAEDFDD
ncbi:hypothetical protein EV645_6525 [Kribbella rubisoli]|uniref:Uncharacterized protein n=1 Tax=Kribbella rubisoli TaxID=3075929 RepID=A0A4Q7WQ81_9ACTN|nr:hypothetical protein [Kribbella rubisoli]RZU11359.1 hypothetical protein EV645_6525 [Kribbella rubisoli]